MLLFNYALCLYAERFYKLKEENLIRKLKKKSFLNAFYLYVTSIYAFEYIGQSSAWVLHKLGQQFGKDIFIFNYISRKLQYTIHFIF